MEGWKGRVGRGGRREKRREGIKKEKKGVYISISIPRTCDWLIIPYVYSLLRRCRASGRKQR